MAPKFFLFSSLALAGCGQTYTNQELSSTPPTTTLPAKSASLTPSGARPVYNLETIVEVVNPFEHQPVSVNAAARVVVSGWAVDDVHKSLAGGVDIAIDGKPYGAQYPMDRQDVADFFKNPAYAKAGFVLTLPAGLLSKGRHTVAVRVVDRDARSYSEGLGLAIDAR